MFFSMPIPMGMSLFFLFASCLIFAGREVFSKKKEYQPAFVGSVLFVNLVILLYSLYKPQFQSMSLLFNETQLTRISSLVFSLHCLLGFVATVILKKNQTFSYLISFLFLSLIGQLILFTDSLFYYPLYFLFYIILINSIVLDFVGKRGLESFRKGVVYALTFLLISVGLVSWMNMKFGTILLTDLRDVTASGFNLSQNNFLILSIFGCLSLLYIFPFNFFDEEYEKSNSWVAFATFRSSGPVLGTLLLGKWIMIEKEAPMIFGREANVDGLFIWSIVFIWSMNLFALFKANQTKEILSSLLLLPLFIALGVTLNPSETSSHVFYASIFFYIFSYFGLAFLLEKRKVLLAGRLDRLFIDNSISRKDGFAIFVITFLCLPLGNQILYRGMEQISFLLGKKEQFLIPKIILMVLSAAYIGLFAIKMTPIFKGMSSLKREKEKLEIYTWLLLIVLVVIGLYPEGLLKVLENWIKI